MGNSSQYVVSGSNDGSLFVWDSHTGEVVNIVRGGGKAIQRVQVRLAGGA
jgi:WD40 repeat protein